MHNASDVVLQICSTNTKQIYATPHDRAHPHPFDRIFLLGIIRSVQVRPNLTLDLGHLSKKIVSA